MVLRVLAIPFVFGVAYFFTAGIQNAKPVFTALFFSLLGASVLLYLLSLLCARAAAKRAGE